MAKSLILKRFTTFLRRDDPKAKLLLLAVPLVLSAFTHIWNITGIPFGPSYDESIYIRRAMHVLAGQGPQESVLYDHPYFAQLFLAGALGIIGYPNSVNPSLGNAHSIEMLYAIPRAIMGVVAIFDTFLIYKITIYRYNSRTVALISSILFAIMPLSWDTRRVLLESVQLPFLLCSILFAISSRVDNSNINSKRIASVLLSGVFLGLAIFTKIPVFTMIPLVAFLIYTKNNRSFRILGLWSIPLILVPLIWPIYATYVDQFDLWLDGIYFQTHRGPNLIFESTNYKIHYAVILLSLGIIATVFAAIKKDGFIFLGIVPYLIFLYFIGYISFWHLIPLLPIVCILIARIADNLLQIANRHRTKYAFFKYVPAIIISGIVILGSITLVTILQPTDNSFYFKAAAYVTQIVAADIATSNTSEINTESKTVLISNPFYSWIPKYVFNINNYEIIDYYDNIPITAKRVIFVIDSNLKAKFNQHTIGNMEKNFNLYSKNEPVTFSDAYNQVSVYQYDSQHTEGTNAMMLQNASVPTDILNKSSRYNNITSPIQ